MNGVKHMSLAMPLRSVILFNWFIVVASPVLWSLVHFCPCFNQGGRGSDVLGSEAGENLLTRGVDWLGFHSFSWVVLFRAGSLSQMIATAQPEWWHQAPMRPGSFTCHLGRYRPGCPNGPDTQASLEVRSSELSLWPHEQVCLLSAEPLLPSKRDEHERPSGWNVRVLQCDSAAPERSLWPATRPRLAGERPSKSWKLCY